ncbi:hypothetical protein ABZ470_37800 [Streptosporangium sp. NPDC020072]|uniref:SCO7613 C-terminal domain-containing membrane protein n=1 Tax=Streptosporangium sp. NPDC020072 TaxID=3154788 RepID=UPI00341AF783
MHDQTRPGCPGCGLPVTGAFERCPRCALTLKGPAAAELWRLDVELAGLRARQTTLLARRNHLLTLLRAESARPAAPVGPGAPAGPAAPVEPAAPVGLAGEAAPRRDFSPKAVQNLLLTLGGLLLIVAAVVFTVVSWGHIGIGGRAAILAGVTALTLAAPRFLTSRKLDATAETIAMFGVALLLLDGYAARQAGLFGADGPQARHYAAALVGLVALSMAGYSRLLPLRLPLPVAVVFAQIPLPLLAFDTTAPWFTASLAADAALDAALLLLLRTSEGKTKNGWATARVCFGVTWTLGVLYGLLDSVLEFTGGGPAVALVRGVLLVALAALGLVVAGRAGRVALGFLTAGSALALTMGLAAPVWPSLPSGWRGVPYTLGALVAVAVALYLPGLNARIRRAGAVSAGAVAGLTALPVVPWVAAEVLMPFGLLERVWAWPAVLDDGWAGPLASAAVVPALLATALAVAAVRWPVTGPRGESTRRSLGLSAVVTGAVAVLAVPGAFALGRPAALVVPSALAVALVARMTLTGGVWWARTLAATAVPVTLIGVVTALAGRTETYAALAVALVAWVVATVAGREPGVRAVALVMAVLSATGLIWAVAVGTGLQPAAEGLALALAAGSVLAVAACLVYGVAVTPEAVIPEAATSEAVEEAPSDSEEDGAKEEPKGGSPVVRRDPRWGAGLGLGATLGACAVSSIAVPLAGIVGFYRPLFFPWTGQRFLPAHLPILVVVAALLTVTAVTVSWQVAGRGTASKAALVALPVLLATLPLSVGLPYPVEVGLFVVGLGPAAWAAARGRTGWRFGAVTGLWTASLALSWSLVAQTATLVTLPVVALVAAATAFLGRERWVRAGGACTATLLAGAQALAVGLALDWPARTAAFGVLALACVAAAVAGRFRKETFAAGTEAAGYALALAGLALAADGLATASLACAVAGVMMTGTALRPDRRRAGYVGTALLLTASWLRLLASDITVVEAYTVPFSLVLLGFGWWRARGRARSSWLSYGPALGSSLLPSAVATLNGTGWVRPLLLGTVCLVVLLVGARARLQAPALLGGLTLAVVVLHELSPWIARAMVTVPRWVPMALGGLLLVVVGATYEARLRDVRRLRAMVGRMR